MAAEKQVDLGVTLTPDLKWEAQVAKVVKKANSTIYLVRRAFYDISVETLRVVYKTYIRPLLEHAISAWSPYFLKDIDLLERVQRRATKIPSCLRNLPYEERLRILKLPTLVDRRARGDLIECYKILHGHYTCDIDIFVRNNNTHLRGHSLKLDLEKCNRLARKYFLTNRVVSKWNSLPASVVTAPSVIAFKKKLDETLGTDLVCGL